VHPWITRRATTSPPTNCGGNALYNGAFGWLEDLRPAAPLQQADLTSTPPTLPSARSPQALGALVRNSITGSDHRDAGGPIPTVRNTHRRRTIDATHPEGNYDTIGGLALHELGHIVEGESIELTAFNTAAPYDEPIRCRSTVTRTDGRRIDQLDLERLVDPPTHHRGGRSLISDLLGVLLTVLLLAANAIFVGSRFALIYRLAQHGK